MNKKILIIDDEKGIASELKFFLNEHSYDVVTANNGEEGFEKIKAEKPDLIITDVLMPKMTGYELAEKLKGQTEEIRKIPVMVISARPRMKEFFEDWNITGFFSKPFDPAVLLEKIKEVLNKKAPPAETPAEPVPAWSFLPPSGKKGMIIGVEEFLIEKLSRFLESKQCIVYRAVDEEEVINQAQNIRPDFILSQFWEDASILDAQKIFAGLSKNPATSSIPFAVFCRENLSLDICTLFNHNQIIAFTASEDLIKKAEVFLNHTVFKRTETP